MSQSSHGPRTPTECAVPASPFKLRQARLTPTRRSSVKSRRSHSNRSSKRSSHNVCNASQGGPSSNSIHVKAESNKMYDAAMQHATRPIRWKPVNVSYDIHSLQRMPADCHSRTSRSPKPQGNLRRSSYSSLFWNQ